MTYLLLSYHLQTIFISLKGWRGMEENPVSGIMGWFRQRFVKPRNELDQGNPCKRCPRNDSNYTSSSHSAPRCSVEPSASSSVPFAESVVLSKPSNSERPLPAVLFSTFRSTRRYDVFVCHSNKDVDQAHSLATYLEDPSKGLRCYMQERDCPLGGAVSTEILQAVHDSHIWVLLITPNFLKDDWCLYQMHQVLSEGVMSQRIIPTVINMPRYDLPQELRFVFSVDLNRNKEAGYTQVYKTVLYYLKDMLEKEEPSNVSQTDN